MMTSEYTKDFPILSAEKEREYIIKAQNGDKQALEYLIVSNMGLIVSMAKRYTGKGIELEDLTQIGTIGFMKAIEKYDDTQNCKLSTYATIWIRQVLMRNIQIYSRTIRTPCHLYQQNFNLMINIKRLEQDLGYTASEKEILDHLKISEKRYKKYKSEILETGSLNKIVTENGQEAMDIIADDNVIDATDGLYIKEITEVVKKVLTDKEWEVFYKRIGLYGEVQTYSQIGKGLGVTTQYIQQIWKGIQAKLRRNTSVKMLRVS